MISRLNSPTIYSNPVTEISELRNESDVEQKLIYPFLTNASYLGLRSEWIRTKEYMTPTAVDKVAGRRAGYFPDYSVWISGIPLLIVEAKDSDTVIEVALREARLYAGEINKRYPPNVNPIGFILACNGAQFGLAPWDSERALICAASDLRPGTEVLDAMRSAVGRGALEESVQKLKVHFEPREYIHVRSFMGGQSRLTEQLGVNEFAEPLFGAITKYFGATSEETPDEVIDRAYVSTDELGAYGEVLETYLKDRAVQRSGNQLKTIQTSKRDASAITTELSKFSQNPAYYSRVQLIIGSVGAGKSTFIRRYYRRLMSREVQERTLWALLNFNFMEPDSNLRDWICESFLKSIADVNQLNLTELEELERIFSHELKRFERGPNKRLRDVDPVEYERRKATYLQELVDEPVQFTECVSRLYSGEKGLGIVVVFDNVDKRSRDDQLAIFEAAQWFKNLTRALVLVNLRDTTFEAHKDEPPLDAFGNAINFYVSPPRFAQVIKKRLELVLDVLPSEVEQRQEYSLSSGARIHYPASRLGQYLLAIYLSLFEHRSSKIGAALEALVAKDVRRALGMFGDLLVSPHIPTNQITTAMVTHGVTRIPEYRIIRSLMRQRYKFYNGASPYIRNVLRADAEHQRPSNFLYADILEYLIRNRKAKIDFNQEGYATVRTVQRKMGSLGYDESDVFSGVQTLADWGLLEPENLVAQELVEDEAVRMHASGFIHMRFFLDREEYLVGVTTDMNFVSRDVAEEIGATWAGYRDPSKISRQGKQKILLSLKGYLRQEYARRCKRHAFYEEMGLGGKSLLSAVDKAVEHISAPQSPGPRR